LEAQMTHTLSVPLSGGKKVYKTFNSSFSTQEIILEHICPARTYSVDSWRMDHREREIMGQEKERKREKTSKTGILFIYHWRRIDNEPQFCEWRK